MSPSASPEKTTRMGAADRRALVLAAATRAFAQDGYAGTSTDAIAREASVSQPYVVRIFGSKLDLFLEVLDGAAERIRAAFEAEVARAPFDPDDQEDWGRLGAVYSGLLTDRDHLLVLMHGFTASAVPEIGRHARRAMGRIHRDLTATGATQDQVRAFIAHGMLLNVMIAIEAPQHVGEDADVDALSACAFDGNLDAELFGA
ncbi:TetR/AcrR family transcriptional regulator [Solicola sp. PLA-1-18]|uniref:TetR/AcrR family transcriptional regulator n=1 Tax=Solicola sp. PLA-1-18 TaxID=3380532 RepID=UPI003B7B94B5